MKLYNLLKIVFAKYGKVCYTNNRKRKKLFQWIGHRRHVLEPKRA